MQLVKIFLLTIFLIGSASTALASPPACNRNLAGLFLVSDLVVEASVIKSRKWREKISTLHLVAQYRAVEVFKGDVKKDAVVIVTFTCLDEARPKDRLGYPTSVNYCPKGRGLNLTGVRSQDGDSMKKEGTAPNWILFLDRDIRKGAPQQTWLEVSETGFSGSGCGKNRQDIPQEQHPGFDRMLERADRLKNALPGHDVGRNWIE